MCIPLSLLTELISTEFDSVKLLEATETSYFHCSTVVSNNYMANALPRWEGRWDHLQGP
jgi:hypothetical protein